MMGLKQRVILMLEFARLRREFAKRFEVVPALTPELARAAFQVRHQVYCRELQWEAEREDGLETDAWDHHSLHCLMRARDRGDFIGCVRLVRPAPDAPDAPLPLELTCGDGLDGARVRAIQPARRRLAEVSRLAIVGRYRRRRHEAVRPAHIADEDYGEVARPRFPYIPVGLYLGMLAMARQEGIETLLLLTEPDLGRHFARLGGRLQPVGDPVEHRGVRLPFAMGVDTTVRRMSLVIRPLYRAIATSVDLGYRARARAVSPPGPPA